MAWKALVPPRLGTQDATGMCLRFAQSFFGAPVRYASAWEAWQHTQGKYSPSDPLPDVPVLLWFEHWGTYGNPRTYANWGHVAAYVPGDAIYTSPSYGYGQERYSTIAQIEQAFNCRYVGWSPDINGLLVADVTAAPPPPPPPIKKGRTMRLVWDTTGTGYLVTEDGIYPLPSAQVYKYFYRLINSDQAKIPFGAPPQVKDAKEGAPDTFYASELAVVNNILRLTAASAMTGVKLDITKQQKAISDALGKKFDQNTELKAAELAAALDKATATIIAAMKRDQL